MVWDWNTIVLVSVSVQCVVWDWNTIVLVSVSVQCVVWDWNGTVLVSVPVQVVVWDWNIPQNVLIAHKPEEGNDVLVNNI